MLAVCIDKKTTPSYVSADLRRPDVVLQKPE